MSQAADHWADVKERGAAWGPALLAIIYRFLGRGLCLVAMTPAVLYFFVTGAKARRASRDYLQRVWVKMGKQGRPGLWHVLRHFFAFSASLVDRFGAWIGHIDRADIDAIDGADFDRMRADPRGALIISGHFGATEVVRALASRYQRRHISIVMHEAQAVKYHAAIQRFAPKSQISIIPAADFNIVSAVEVSAAIERGEWVVMMADRMPVRRDAPSIEANFLGSPTAFPQGPFVLAAALRCPIYTLFCYRGAGGYKAAVGLLSDGVSAPRRRRMEALGAIAQRYADTLERLVQEAPYQWFNFYDYWPSHGDGGTLAGGAKH